MRKFAQPTSFSKSQFRLLVAAFLLCLTALPLSSARAEFRVCNETEHSLALAVGHSNGLQWISEGWWNIAAQECAVVLEGALRARYYYLHALHYEIGGGWTGDRYFCTAERSFTINGRKTCEDRGYVRSGFFEVDTADALDYTHLLSDDE